MHRDGWRLVVAQSPLADARHQWANWMELQAVSPADEDVRVDSGRALDGDWSRYWVRGQIPLAQAARVVLVEGSTYDARRRQNNTVVATCSDRDQIGDLIRALDTSEEGRPSLMTPGSSTLAFLRSRAELIAAITVIEGRWIRCAEHWSGDAELLAPDSLQRWIDTCVA